MADWYSYRLPDVCKTLKFHSRESKLLGRIDSSTEDYDTKKWIVRDDRVKQETWETNEIWRTFYIHTQARWPISRGGVSQLKSEVAILCLKLGDLEGQWCFQDERRTPEHLWNPSLFLICGEELTQPWNNSHRPGTPGGLTFCCFPRTPKRFLFQQIDIFM